MSACAARGEATHPARTDGFASTSLCADNYLLALETDRIAALSWQAGSALSTAPEALLDRPRLWDSREALHGLSATVISGPGGLPGDVVLEWGEDFSAVRRNIATLQAIGIDRSDTLGNALSDLDRLPRPARKPRILYLARSGGSAGPGTYVDAVIAKAGGENAAQAPGWHTPSIETVLGMEPDIILTSFFGSDYHGANDRALRHGALRRFIAARPTVDVPGKLWPCAGPGLIEATRIVNDAILAWDAER